VADITLSPVDCDLVQWASLSRMKRVHRQFLLAVAASVILLYMIGGVSGLRRLRARMRSWAQPPTAAEMQRAGPDTVTSLPKMPTRTRDGRRIPFSEPPSPVEVGGVVLSVVVLAIVLMGVTGRDHPRVAQ
jgi:hypothetical protein